MNKNWNLDDLGNLFETPTKFVRKCAYCQIIYGIYAEGKYFELGPNKEYDPSWPVSHGACLDCAKKIEEET